MISGWSPAPTEPWCRQLQRSLWVSPAVEVSWIYEYFCHLIKSSTSIKAYLLLPSFTQCTSVLVSLLAFHSFFPCIQITSILLFSLIPDPTSLPPHTPVSSGQLTFFSFISSPEFPFTLTKPINTFSSLSLSLQTSFYLFLCLTYTGPPLSPLCHSLHPLAFATSSSSLCWISLHFCRLSVPLFS